MPHSDFVWVPMLETRLSKGERVESYWPVGLTETDFMCVIVKVGRSHAACALNVC
jgi:hypothetical protein